MTALAQPSWVQRIAAGRVQEFYSRIGVDLPEGDGEASVSCFAAPWLHKNEDRNKSCSVNLRDGQWKCHGCGAEGNAYKAALAKGLAEREAADLAKRYRLFLEREKVKFKMGGASQWTKWMLAMQAHPHLIPRLGRVKGWTGYGIQRCGLGWCAERERIVFVYLKQRNFGGREPCGAAYYLPNGEPKMIAHPGSERLFFPAPEAMVKDRPLFVVEGEPDAVAVWSTGHQATAIPGVNSWKADWAYRIAAFKRLILLGDCDPQGRELMGKVKTVLPRSEVVDLDASRNDGFDIGDLLLEATQADGVQAGASQVKLILDGLAA